MNSTFVTTKYASTRLALAGWAKKASSWVREHRKALSILTSVVALLVLSWVLAQQGGWGALITARLRHPWLVALAVALVAPEPRVGGLEVAGAVLEGDPRRGHTCPMAALAGGLAGSVGWPNLGHRGTAALG